MQLLVAPSKCAEKFFFCSARFIVNVDIRIGSEATLSKWLFVAAHARPTHLAAARRRLLHGRSLYSNVMY